jgi:hypothetical protein
VHGNLWISWDSTVAQFFVLLFIFLLLLLMLINGKDFYSSGDLGMFFSSEWERRMQNFKHSSDQLFREKNA